MEFKNNLKKLPLFIIASPFIYGMIIPLLFLDITGEIYHRICFKIYDIPYIKRGNYIKIDRHHLKYLSFFEKCNCVYCGYANGLMHYLTKIAGETENFWCSIKHQKRNGFLHPVHHTSFIEYGNESIFNEKFRND